MTRSRRPHHKIRIIALAAVCCVALFALTAPAFAMPIQGPLNAHDARQSTGVPVVKAGDTPATRDPGSAATTDAPSYRSGDIASTRVPIAPAPAFRAGDVASTRVPSSTPTFVSVPSSPRIVQDNGDQTLAIVLAGSALGIALAGAGFALLRTRMPKAAGLH